MEPTTILTDDREIDGIWYPGEDTAGYCVSSASHRCEKIVAYSENGHMAPIPFFAVYRDGEIFARIPANLVEVQYKKALKE